MDHGEEVVVEDNTADDGPINSTLAPSGSNKFARGGRPPPVTTEMGEDKRLLAVFCWRLATVLLTSELAKPK